MILETERWIRDTLFTAQANEKSTKINLRSHSTNALFHQPVPLYVPGQHMHIAIVLNGAMLGVVLVEGETVMKTCNESKMGHRNVSATLHPTGLLVTMSVSLSFLNYLFPVWRNIIQNLANMWPDFVDSLKIIATSLHVVSHIY